MTKLAHKLGLSSQLEFQDVWSVTDEDLLFMIPRPVHAILFLFPMSENVAVAQKEDDDAMEVYQGSGPDEPVLWFPQIIGNACGLIGMLHCASNGVPATQIVPESELDKIVKAATLVKPQERDRILYDSPILEIMHGEAAQEGDSVVPEHGADVDYGFVAFVRGKDNHLYELDGARKGPLDRGLVQPDEDILSERVLGLSVFPYINREKVDETRFSVIALVDAQTLTNDSITNGH